MKSLSQFNPKELTPEERKEARKMFKSGKYYVGEIADYFGVTRYEITKKVVKNEF